MSEITLTFDDIDLMEFYGQDDVKINIIRRAFPTVNIIARGSTVKLSGPRGETQAVKHIFENMSRIIKQFKEISAQSVEEMVGGNNPFENKIPGSEGNSVIIYSKDGHPIRARTKNQKKMVELSEEKDILFALGPAGTGKTYTAVALAVKALKNRLVKRIVLTRPAVEAGESLGFLPGDMKDKIDPYLRPLYDALNDLIQFDKLQQLMQSNVIEIAPLAFMRGRTLDNAFIILDEAQNTTDMQIKMFLTRLGPSAKCIITGDLTQIDLPHHQRSGVLKAMNLLQNIQGIGFLHLNSEDVVRHRLVKEIIKAYEKDDEFRRIKKAAAENKEEIVSEEKAEKPEEPTLNPELS